MQKRKHIKNNGLVSLDPCINCTKAVKLNGIDWIDEMIEFYRKHSTKKQAVLPLRPKLSGFADPLRGKPSWRQKVLDATNDVTVRPPEIIWDEWTHRKESVYTPNLEPLTFQTEYICEFLAKDD